MEFGLCVRKEKLQTGLQRRLFFCEIFFLCCIFQPWIFNQRKSPPISRPGRWVRFADYLLWAAEWEWAQLLFKKVTSQAWLLLITLLASCAGMTEDGKWRVLEAQHPLLSGWNPTFQGFIAAALLLANLKAIHLITIHCRLKKTSSRAQNEVIMNYEGRHKTFTTLMPLVLIKLPVVL